MWFSMMFRTKTHRVASYLISRFGRFVGQIGSALRGDTPRGRSFNENETMGMACRIGVLGLVCGCFSSLGDLRHANGQGFQITQTQFESWIFSGMQNSIAARKALTERIEIEIDRVEQFTPLEESQKKNIRFAGKGDISRFFMDVDEAIEKFKQKEAQGEIGQDQINELYQLAMPLQQRLNKGLFGADSLLKKVARATVNDQQAAELKKRQRNQEKRKLELAYAAYVGNLNRHVPMTTKQRDAFLGLLRNDVKISSPSGQYLTYVIMIKLSELPAEKIEAIFDDAQINAIRSMFPQAKMIKASLKQMGAWDE